MNFRRFGGSGNLRPSFEYGASLGGDAVDASNPEKHHPALPANITRLPSSDAAY